MMFKVIRIAFRNTRRQTKRTVLLGGAIAFGVMIVTLLNAFTSGAVGNIKTNFSYAVGGHIFISGSHLSASGREIGRLGDDGLLRSVIDDSDPRVFSVHRRSRAFVTLIFGSRSVLQRIDGVDFARETDLARGVRVLEGSLDRIGDPRALLLPEPVAERLGVGAGETVLARLETVTGQQNVGEFLVVAVIEDTSSFGFSTAYAGLAHLNELIGLDPAEYQLYNVFLRDMGDIDSVADQAYRTLQDKGVLVERPLQGFRLDADMDEEGFAAFAQLFGQSGLGAVDRRWEGTKYSVTTLNELMQPIVAAMGILDAAALVIFVILLAITGVGILNTFRMIIIERTREIGTMRAFGMPQKAVRSIFLWEAAAIGTMGGVVGLAAAGIVAAIVSHISFAHVQGLEFFLDGGHFTFVVSPWNLAVNVGILLAMSLLAAWIPANAAAKLRPVKALGAHY